MNIYYVYMLECADKTIYTGITTSIDRRLHEHNNTKRGAKYTRFRRPVKLICCYPVGNRSEALKEEFKVKKLLRKDKLLLSSNKGIQYETSKRK